MVAMHTPLCVPSDARRTTLLTIAVASDRSAAPWRAHGDALAEPQGFSLGLASERGRGLVAGDQAAGSLAMVRAAGPPAHRAGRDGACAHASRSP